MKNINRYFLICWFVALTLSANAEEKAQRLLQRMENATKSLKTLSAHLELSYKTPGRPIQRSSGTVQLMRPNYALITLKGVPTQTLASDGQSRVLLDQKQNYTQAAADRQGKNIDEPWWGLPFRYFFTQSVNPFGPQMDKTATFRYLGRRNEQGRIYHLVQVKGQQPLAYIATLTIGSDNLLYRTEVVFGGEQSNASFRAALTQVKTNQSLKVDHFQYQIPKTARLDPGYEAKLIALGKQAPEFTLPTLTNDPLSLTHIRQEAKATLINFWYLDCPPCLEELPIFQKMYSTLADQGLAFVAVDKGDSATNIQEYWKKRGYTLPVVLGNEGKSTVFAAYGVEAFPVSILLDATGKIVFRSVGFDEKGLRDALEKQGFKKW